MIQRSCVLTVGTMLVLLLGIRTASGVADVSAADLGAGRAENSGEDWPRWRGPRGDGSWNGPKLSAHWPAELKLRWRKPTGGGYAGVIVAGNRVLLADRQVAPSEAERIVCYDARTGAVRWTHSDPVHYGQLDYGNGPRAAPTVFDGLVYTLGATGKLNCLDLEKGSVRWKADLVTDFQGRMPTWGYAASPLIFRDTVIVHPGSAKGASVVALNRRTGKKIWASLSDEATYATPMLIEQAGRTQLVCWTPSHIRGLDASTGEPLWEIPYEVTYGVSIATPVYHAGLVFVSGYWAGAKAIRIDASGRKASLAWEDERTLRGLMSQPLCRDGFGYLLDKNFGLTCFEMATGKKIWADGHRVTPRDTNPQATFVWIGDGDRVLILNAAGELILARLDPKEYTELARSKIIDDTWAHPAYAGRYVYARSDHEILCRELPVETSAGERGPK
ncbi:MAG TPA: PQQ-binding-like beta-propeller repeat protein [Planctomycetaceae bacterium]|jgi:outer membrane protein assembly factor BamB|nr:PQQ-binding-like beta-propeller repeat protein [Planctomycetaceae bacterium]